MHTVYRICVCNILQHDKSMTVKEILVHIYMETYSIGYVSSTYVVSMFAVFKIVSQHVMQHLLNV